MSIFAPSLKRRVMATINERIDAAQLKHDQDLEALEKRQEAERDALTDMAVRDFLSSVLPK